MISEQIADFLGEKINNYSPVGGGCIAQTGIIKTNKGNTYFLKQGFSNTMFTCEANGLHEIAKAGCIKTPKVILAKNDFLLLEWIKQGSKTIDFFKLFGKQIAQMHQNTQKQFGFFEHNFIGATPQINTIEDNWTDFYFTHRLLFQYQLAEQKGYVTPELQTAFQKLEKIYPSILAGSEERPALLHGDLWGGNYMVDKNGEPVLIDPAAYYGHREADLAMTHLFGGFSPDFYLAYQQTNPLKDGWEYREKIYLLYHVLNHMNLFGNSYYTQTMQLINYYL
jgi:fructosamine-3-kinase